MSFSYLLTAFFQKYLAAECGLATHSIASYSDCIKLLIRFACTRFGVQPEELSINQFDRELIIDFLDDLEHNRHNEATTRNQRLAAIKTLFHFLAYNVPELMHRNETIQAIRQKKTDHTPPPSMTIEEVEAIAAVPDQNRLIGARDKALVKLMYNSGARVQELADLRICDIRFDSPATVTLTGKGGKTRVIPLWENTLDAIRHYMKFREHSGVQSDHLFLNVKGQPMTRFGIGRRIDRLARQAAEHCPSLRGRRITPHVYRHTIALHLLENDNDIVVVQEWLGHADLRTTSQYLEVSIQRKRAALARVPPPSSDGPIQVAQWKQPAFMALLTQISRGVMLRNKRKGGHNDHNGSSTALFAT
jgi:site-specific recombinase XerD